MSTGARSIEFVLSGFVIPMELFQEGPWCLNEAVSPRLSYGYINACLPVQTVWLATIRSSHSSMLGIQCPQIATWDPRLVAGRKTLAANLFCFAASIEDGTSSSVCSILAMDSQPGITEVQY